MATAPVVILDVNEFKVAAVNRIAKINPKLTKTDER
jgi:hypothetical protein